MSDQNAWYVYILECADGSLYTGITTDISRREKEHNSKTLGARYTRSRQPVELVYHESWPDRASAAKREYAIKQLDRSRKLQLIRNVRQ